MSDRIRRRLRKQWHIHRHQRRRAPVSHRLSVAKADWMHDADSPVVLMVDDLTNAWHGGSSDGSWAHGGDWGGGLDSPNGIMAFLDRELLRDFPEVRITFFVVAGAISAYTHHQPFSYAAPLDAGEESRRFFASLNEDPRFELAYHGYNHGLPGASTDEFVQEWRSFESPDAAAAQTRDGLEIFRRATGGTPRGGKYGGWDYNRFSGDVVNDLGFLWWCRDWMPRDVSGHVADDYYEPRFFGSELVVGLPSTVHGELWDPKQIDTLLEKRQVISIEEHIAGVRPDGLTQTPNVVDDIHELRRLYRYLRSKNVWHANCTEIAAYVVARELSLIRDETLDGFSMRYQGRVPSAPLSLRIDASAICSPRKPVIRVVPPDGAPIPAAAYRFDERRFHHLVTVPVMDGDYRVEACADPSVGG